MPQPHIQPTYDPNALVDQVNDAPQSGCAGVQFAIGVGGEEHRDETGDEDRRHLQSDGGDDESDAGGQRVSGRDGCDAEDRTGECTDLAFSQTLGHPAGGLLGVRHPPRSRQIAGLGLILGTTNIGTSSTRSIFAAVEPRNRRLGAPSRLDPTMIRSPSCHSVC